MNAFTYLHPVVRQCTGRHSREARQASALQPGHGLNACSRTDNTATRSELFKALEGYLKPQCNVSPVWYEQKKASLEQEPCLSPSSRRAGFIWPTSHQLSRRTAPTRDDRSLPAMASFSALQLTRQLQRASRRVAGSLWNDRANAPCRRRAQEEPRRRLQRRPCRRRRRLRVGVHDLWVSAKCVG